MSYSIGKTAATKAELEVAIRDELSKVPETQPVHAVDIDQAFNAASSLIVLMTDALDRDMYCSVSGSIYNPETGIESISINVSVNMQNRKPKE